MNNELIVATLWELVEKVQSQNYVKSVLKIDEKIVVEYKDGFKQRINLPITTLQEISKPIDTSFILEELKIVINSLIDEKYKILQQVLSEAIAKLPTPKDGAAGKDADEELILTKLKKQIETLILAIPEPKDGVNGKDADEQAIKDVLFLELQNQITSFQTLLDLKITEGLQYIISVIPTPKDGINGQDGKDIDAEVVIARLSIEIKKLIEDIKKELEVTFLRQLADKVSEEIELAKNSFKPLQGDKGESGVDGRDADESKIIREVLRIVDEEVKLLRMVSKQQIKEGLRDVKASIPKVKDGKDGKSIKGDKGDKGERGNSVKDAEIDSSGHLIIKTDERKIDAGKVSVNNFFGSGGGTPKYTNSKPTPWDFGGLKKGTRFKDVDLRELFTKLFYGYEFPEFTMFSIKYDNKILQDRIEIGDTIHAGSYIFNWTITNTELLEEKSIVIEQNGLIIGEKLDNTPAVTFELQDIKKDIPTDINFLISAYDTTGVSFMKSVTTSFMYRLYYGEYDHDLLDEYDKNNNDFPNYLNDLKRKDDLVNDLTITTYRFINLENIPAAHGYRWFCYPAVFGENYIFYDVQTDIAILFIDKVPITIKNKFGLLIDYYCYRTENELFNDFEMRVKRV